MAQDFFQPDDFDQLEDVGLFERAFEEEDPPRISWPIIFFSTACGAGLGILALYVAYRIIQLPLPWSAGLATLCMIGVLGGMSAGLSILTRAHTLANVALSCGLIVVTLFFFGLCSFVGALAATLLLTLQPT